MGHLKETMIKYMKSRGYSESSIESYISCVSIFARHLNKSPLVINKDEITSFFIYLHENNKSGSTIHIYYNSIKLFYLINNINDRMPKMSFRNIKNKIPLIISQEKVIQILNSCTSLIFKTIFSLLYSSGLRISELVNLKLNDIDFERKQIYIKTSKNKKGRYSLIGNKTSSLLKTYMNVNKPNSYLFPSYVDCSSNISIDIIRNKFKKLLIINGLDPKEIHLHTLRHCFATHLLENGTSIFYIMHLLGHSNIQTTMVYLHMQNLDKLNIQSPIDMLDIPEVVKDNQLFPLTA